MIKFQSYRQYTAKKVFFILQEDILGCRSVVGCSVYSDPITQEVSAGWASIQLSNNSFLEKETIAI